MRIRRVAVALALIGITGVTLAAGRDEDDDRRNGHDDRHGRDDNVAITPPFFFDTVYVQPVEQQQFLTCVVTNLSKQPRQVLIQFVNGKGEVRVGGSPPPTIAPGASTLAGTAGDDSGILRCMFTVLNGTKRDIIAQGTLTLIERNPSRIGATTVQAAQ